MTGGPLLHELGKEPGLVAGTPLVCHLVKDKLSHRAATPEGDDRPLIGIAIRGAHAKGGLFAGVQDVEIL